MKPQDRPTDTEFSLVLGGPLYQIFRKAYLIGGTLDLLKRRILVLTLVSWLPLALLQLATGVEGLQLTFWQDLEVHVRFLVAMPLLIVAELAVHRRMRPLIQRFTERGLVTQENEPQFQAYVASALRWRNSVLAEILLILFVYLVGMGVIWRQYVSLQVETWYCAGGHLTPSGFWYVGISIPFFQFLLLRWYFRVLIWTRFLWQVSRIPLAAVPSHPDGVGGLGFLGQVVQAFAPLLMAHGALLAGHLANRILFLGEKLIHFKGELATMVGFLLAIVLSPLLFFTPQLLEIKRRGSAEYGRLAMQYVREFEQKWLGTELPSEPLLGSADIQSLADLNGAYEVVESMGVVPFNRSAITLLTGATLLPIVPLGLTMMPLEELLKKLMGILF